MSDRISERPTSAAARALKLLEDAGYTGFILAVRTRCGGTVVARHGDTAGLRNAITTAFKED